ncbi:MULTISPECIES: hypothetical protein [unclassified Ochrobactrum]|uniref:hypothetical protein n=1 Tax=unclassified Ochrobactrum TaxID=239106 RepID=UPI0040457E67
MEFRVVDTDPQSAEFDKGISQDNIRIRITIYIADAGTVCPIVEAGFSKSLQGAEFGFRTGRGAKRKAGSFVPAFAINARVDIVAALNIVTQIAVDTQAGFRAGDVEIARAIGVANTHILNTFRLWRDDCVGSIG